MALPEIIENTCFLLVEWKQKGGMEERGGGQRWIDYVRGLSEQCVLRCDQTRMEYRLETSVVTRIGENTTPINNKKKRE